MIPRISLASSAASLKSQRITALRHLGVCQSHWLRQVQSAAAANLPHYSRTHNRITDIVKTPNFLNNAFIPSQSKTWFEVHDPATGNLVTQVAQSTDAELRAAVESAQQAFPKWKKTTVLHRQQIMFKLTSLVRENSIRLATAISIEQGKTFLDAKAEIHRGVQVTEHLCGIPSQWMGSNLEVADGMETRTFREPLGVVAAVCPFNFPAMIPLWIISLATATGNCVVVKPSERTPGAANIIADLAREAGMPDGVISIVHGGVKTVEFLTSAPEIKAVSFIGGNAAGNYVHTQASAHGKKVQANLGAKNHAALYPDSDKTRALQAIVGGAFGAAGQRCMAVSVLVTVGDAKDWIPDLVREAQGLTVSAAFEENADLGPVVSAASKQRIESLIQSAEDDGATILLDGRGHQVTEYPKGNFIGPTIITNVTPAMECYKQEIFGPVLLCISVETEDEAIDLINANAYGNGVALFTENGTAAEHFRREIQAGQVGINVAIPVPLPMFSFTGNKNSISGQGNHYFLGTSSINFFTQTKTVTSLWKRGNMPTGGTKGRASTVMPTQS